MAIKNNKEPFIMCDRCKRLYNALAVGLCKHEAVNKHYGQHICLYCCSKCKHHEKLPLVGGVKCTL